MSLKGGFDLKRFLLAASVAALAISAFPTSAIAQEMADDADAGDAVIGEPTSANQTDGQTPARVFTLADLERFAPRNALDMLQAVPGFTLRREDGERGLGQASANVVINGARIASKSDGVVTQLQRITTNRVERIEIIDGATLGIPGLSGQVANVITRPSAISGRFTYRSRFRPRYAAPSYLGGEVSLSGTVDNLEWTVALSNNSGRGGAGGGEAFIFGPDGEVLETREIHQQFVGDTPRVAGNVQYTTAAGTIINANANYRRVYDRFRDNQQRNLTDGIDRFRMFENRDRGWGYELGGDIEFGLAGGTLKLIGQERYNRNRGRSESIITFDETNPDAGPDVGTRFSARTETGERIGRAEYSWNMLGGDWQLAGEAAFNRLSRSAQLFELNPQGDFDELPFPNGTGGVTEDRYESILTHSRRLASNLTIQLGAGAEYSTLTQAGGNGLTRSFWRPKGSVNLAWQVEEGLDVSFEVARRVGQLSFGDFLASVSLNQNQQNAGNVQLVPPQRWEASLEATKSLGPWGTTELRIYAREIEDFIEFIPVDGGLETRGNIDSASVYGVVWNSTFELAPAGLNGMQLELTVDLDKTSLIDPLTGEERSWSRNRNREIDVMLRHDIPQSNWAWGVGLEYRNTLPYYRLGETGLNYEGPTYTYGFVEHKDVLGMTASLTVFNLTDGRARQDRLVFEGYRDRTQLAFRETQNLSVQPIFNFSLRGDF